MVLQQLKLVTFDVTNTLLKFRVPAWQYYAMVAHEHGFKGTEEDVKTKFKKSFKMMWEKHPNFGKTSIKWEDWWCRVVKMTLQEHLPPTADINYIANKLIDEFKTDRCWQIADGGDKLIERLRKHGLTVGVISNFDPRLNDILQNVSLHSHFNFIVTSYDTGFSKPDERIFKTALSKCQSEIKPSEALHIGDDLEKDYEGARAAGWHALLVNPKLKPDTSPSQEHIFKNLHELDSKIEQKQLIL